MKKIFYRAFLFGVAWTAGLAVSCDKGKQLPPEERVERVLPQIEDVDDGVGGEGPGEPNYLHVARFLSGENADTDGSGIDLATGEVFHGTNVHNYMHAIDLLYMDYDNATNGNIVLPESRELSVNELGEDIQYGWRHKNSGVLYRLEDVQPHDVEWFNGLKSAERIATVVDSMIAVLSVVPDNQKQRYRNIKKDQILVFKSSTRNISSAIYVSQQTAIGSGSQCRLIIKSDATELQEVPLVTGGLLNANGNFYADVMEASFARNSKVALFFDFKDKRIYNVYTAADLDEIGDFSGIGMIVTFDANDARRHRIMSPRSPSFTTYDAGLSSYLNNLENQLQASKRRPLNTYMRRATVTNGRPILANHPFSGLRLNNLSLKNFYNLFVPSPNNSELGNAWNNNQAIDNIWVINHVRADGGDAYGAFRFVNIDKAATGSGDGKIEFEVKYYNSLD